MLLSFDQNCLHLTFKPYWSSETYSRKYEKLPKIVIHASTNISEKMNLLKMCGPQIRLCLFTCLFTYRLIASKWLNSLTTIDTTSRVQFPAPTRVFMFEVLFYCYCVFTFCPETHYLSHNCVRLRECICDL